MSLQVIFLGTAGSVPTPSRSPSAIALLRRGELIIFDCGEGIQRQMMKVKLGFDRRTKIFLTHMHGDHILGLPGLLQTMSLLARKKTLQVYGPTGVSDFIEAVKKTVHFAPTFPLEIKEVEVNESECIFEGKEFGVHATPASHSIPALAFSFIEKPRPGKFHPDKAEKLSIPKGKLWGELQRGLPVKLGNGQIIKPDRVVDKQRLGRKVVYTGDSKPCTSIENLAQNADLLIHDCTFADDLATRASEDGHSTPSQAAETAKLAGVERLVLTHISARYKDTDLLLEQASKVFSNVVVASDLMRIELPLRSKHPSK